MSTSRHKFELSPRLKLGVGRGHTNKILKAGAIACLSLAVVLAAYAFHLIISSDNSGNRAAPQVLGASDVKSNNPQPQFLEYQVTQGDTLFNISQKYNISWATLATLNNLKSPFTLKSGQILQIPQ